MSPSKVQWVAVPASTLSERIVPRFVAKSGRLPLGLLATASLLVGCTTAKISEVREGVLGIEAYESVTVVFPRDAVLKDRVKEQIVGCIAEGARKASHSVRTVPPEEFLRIAFPDLDPEEAPGDPQNLTLLLSNPTFTARIAPLRLRYLISVRGSTTQSKPEGGGGCVPAPGGCFGGWSWHRESQLSASFVDLKHASGAGEVSVSVTGRPWFAIVGIFPLGLPAFTQTRACRELGDGVARFLTGSEAPER